MKFVTLSVAKVWVVLKFDGVEVTVTGRQGSTIGVLRLRVWTLNWLKTWQQSIVKGKEC
jgi:hypothetical protein